MSVRCTKKSSQKNWLCRNFVEMKWFWYLTKWTAFTWVQHKLNFTKIKFNALLPPPEFYWCYSKIMVYLHFRDNSMLSWQPTYLVDAKRAAYCNLNRGVTTGSNDKWNFNLELKSLSMPIQLVCWWDLWGYPILGVRGPLRASTLGQEFLPLG